MAAYYLGTLLYVKTMIRERGSQAYVVASVAFHALAAGTLASVSWWLAAVFSVLTLRAALAPRLRLTDQSSKNCDGSLVTKRRLLGQK
jgi:hypothetical protein